MSPQVTALQPPRPRDREPSQDRGGVPIHHEGGPDTFPFPTVEITSHASQFTKSVGAQMVTEWMVDACSRPQYRGGWPTERTQSDSQNQH